jgi:fatty-acyl-CoA synthase
MGSDELYRPLHVTDLLVNALNEDPDRPLLQLLGGPMLTVCEVRDEASRYVQALASLGVGRETRVALLSALRAKSPQD